MKSALFFLLVGIAVCAAYVTVEGPAPNTPKGTCISQKVGKMNVGQKKSVPSVCEVAECLANGQVSYSGCSSVNLPPKCKYDKFDKNSEYPKCCPSTYSC
ncbi:PREDICTED: uncharacterized protein LOC108569975 [Nicrophorus vespilloides]|uniref:Uncharacterized protein LOC108569975 n=1 Tax=Nicrophorus vespilloides TaxID=110193 RepID=A0ABM1NKB3_NICVS|nr:PREDICTED: uncharacterized protein LOC108569975 [Nicrophorus vespilloides]